VLTDIVYMEVTSPVIYIKTGSVKFSVINIVFGSCGLMWISAPVYNLVSVRFANILVKPEISLICIFITEMLGLSF